MLTIRRITPANLADITPIADNVLVGEEALVQIGRGGITLSWAPVGRASWQPLPQRADADAELLCSMEDAAVFGAFMDGAYVGGACMYAAYDGWAELCDLRVDAMAARLAVSNILQSSRRRMVI